jgi:hypothetical protein
MTVEQFLWSVVAGILSGLVLVAVVALTSRTARWILTGLLGRVLRIDIDYVFSNSNEAQGDVRESVEHSNDVRILTGRGHDLQLDAFASLFQRRPQSDRTTVRVLLPSVRPTQSEFDWTDQRERELASFDPAFGHGLLKRQVQMTAEFLAGHSGPLLEVRRYEAPHLGRVIITDRFAYLTLYRRRAHGRQSEVLKIRRGELYDGLARLFELVWEASVEARPA